MTSTLTLIAAFVLPRFILLAWEFSGHPCPFSTSIVLSVATHTLLYITTVIYAGIFFFRPIFMYLLYDSKKLVFECTYSLTNIPVNISLSCFENYLFCRCNSNHNKLISKYIV